jgi:hypothetical protein
MMPERSLASLAMMMGIDESMGMRWKRERERIEQLFLRVERLKWKSESARMLGANILAAWQQLDVLGRLTASSTKRQRLGFNKVRVNDTRFEYQRSSISNTM